MTTRRQVLSTDRWGTPEEWTAYWKTVYGPTMAIYAHVADNADDVAALDADLTALAARYDRGAPGAMVLDWEYLVVTARRSA